MDVAKVQRSETPGSVVALANLLNGNSRRRPVAVITIPAGRDEPWIDVDAIAREAGNLAEVHLIPTGALTWEFSSRMADGTQVYGGAGRVYPVGHEWATDLSRSPLRFAFDAADGERATQQLISDVLTTAAAAGLHQTVPAQALRRVKGTVKGTVAGRALVDVGNARPAAIAAELTVEGVPIERIVSAGQRINGRFEAESNRVDVRESLRESAEALSAYSVGDVVLTRVAKVRNGKAQLVLYPATTGPEVVVAVLREDVTTNPLDDLRTLMTVGEVVPARVAAAGSEWALVLNDVDDDEPILDAPSLLPGGPPWLIEEIVEPLVDEPTYVVPAPLPMPAAEPQALVEEPAAPVTEAPKPTSPRPTPAIFDRNRPRPAAPTDAAPTPPPSLIPPIVPAPVQAPSTKSLLLKIDGLNAENGALERDRDTLQTQLRAAADEREQLRYLLHQAERRANGAEHELKATRARLRKAGNTKATSPIGDEPRFADPEVGFRHLVLTRWASRLQPAEQAERPLLPYDIGEDFIESLHRLEGIKQEKVADVVVEVVTGLVTQIAGRELHRLRSGPGGDDPVRIREADHAAAWRASLQVRTPSARRLHYWVLPGGTIELARVATHDDFHI